MKLYHYNKTNRRNFIMKVATAAAATSVGAVSWANICSSDRNRSHYKVFSKANIGKLRLKIGWSGQQPWRGPVQKETRQKHTLRCTNPSQQAVLD